MIEFEVIQEIKQNNEILESIKNYTYIVKNGKVKHLPQYKFKNYKSIDNYKQMF